MAHRPILARPIVAMGGGGFAGRTDPRHERSPLDDLILDLAVGRKGRIRPRICFLATATGDDPRVIGRFHAAFDHRAETTHLGLFDRTVADIEGLLLDQDVVYVGGGNTASLLAVWRTHGVDAALRRAHAAGVVLAGRSAGAICWFEAGTTDSWGPALGAVHGGLGLIPGSHSPHYDGEAQRRPTFQRLVAAGDLPDGWAADDGVALIFDGPTLVEAVTERDGARAYRVVRHGERALETPIPTRRLA
jgi:dipeptidase E